MPMGRELGNAGPCQPLCPGEDCSLPWEALAATLISRGTSVVLSFAHQNGDPGGVLRCGKLPSSHPEGNDALPAAG